ncbi:MAG TPA: hypothetical protein VI913_05570 [Candidatus Peribacteraceae bacterium]|nr:hypothetical protein [Candidatus Peribacteraceae bacterium]
MDEKKPLTFADIKAEHELRWNVREASWQYMSQLADIEETYQEANRELKRVTEEIGVSVIEGGAFDPLHVHRGRELQEQIENSRLQKLQIQDQARAAMRSELVKMLSPETVEVIRDEELEAFFNNLEEANQTQITVSRLLGR